MAFTRRHNLPMILPFDIHPYLPTKEGFCHPDWESLALLIEETVPEADWGKIWQACARIWVEELRLTLGDRHHVHDTPNFLVLNEARPSVSKDACAFCEESLQRISKTFYGLVPGFSYGKQVVLMFDRPEDYHRYVLYFFPDGPHPMTGGVFLKGEGYPHLAVLTSNDAFSRTVLVHELTHACFSRFKLPAWLNEALAMRMERAICGTDPYPLDRELRDRHVAHWNRITIQQFWSGRSWDLPDENIDLHYSLAQILWRTIESELIPPPEALKAFLGTAHRDNAGEEAFQAIFDLGLGGLVTKFLGEGKWTPRPERWDDESVIFPPD
jgi:hypothetical protein